MELHVSNPVIEAAGLVALRPTFSYKGNGVVRGKLDRDVFSIQSKGKKSEFSLLQS